jgi:hypothetical protein
MDLQHLVDEWYYEEFNSYEPDIELLNNLESSGGLAGVDITIVMGTWCSDSRREVPRFTSFLRTLILILMISS